MPLKCPQSPAYRRYKPKNLAVVRIDGRDFYLGAYDSPESWRRYYQLLADRASRLTRATPAFSLSQLPAAMHLVLGLSRVCVYRRR